MTPGKSDLTRKFRPKAGLIRRPERSCRRWQLIVYSIIYEASCILGMHLRFCYPRRSQVAPLRCFSVNSNVGTLSHNYKCCCKKISDCVRATAFVYRVASHGLFRWRVCRKLFCLWPARSPVWLGRVSSIVPVGPGYSLCAQPHRSVC